jgi:hypothetical protein
VKFINSYADLPFEFSKMCKNYTLKCFKTDSKELSLLYAELKKMEPYNEKLPPKPKVNTPRGSLLSPFLKSHS